MIIGSLQKTENTSLSGVLPNPGNMTLHNYGEINAAIGLGKAIINSGIFTGGVLLATLVFGILAGYALARLSFRGRGLLFALMLLVLTVPFQLLIIPLYVLIARNYGLANSYLGMIAPFAINSVAVLIFRQYFMQLPAELFDAARIDGASELKVLINIALPLVRPAVLTAMLLTFIGPWNEFLWPFLITKQQSLQPLAVALANYIDNVAATAFESVRRDPGRSVRAGRARGRIDHRLPAVLRFHQYRLRRERLTVTRAGTTSVPGRPTRLGVVISADPESDFAAEGVLNPARPERSRHRPGPPPQPAARATDSRGTPGHHTQRGVPDCHRGDRRAAVRLLRDGRFQHRGRPPGQDGDTEGSARPTCPAPAARSLGATTIKDADRASRSARTRPSPCQYPPADSPSCCARSRPANRP